VRQAPGGEKSGPAAIAIGPQAARRAGWRPGFAESLALLPESLRRAITHEIDHRRLFLWLPVAMGLGVLAYAAAETEPSLAASGVPLVLTAVGAGLARRRLWPMAALLAVAVFFAGFHLAGWRSRLVAAPVLAVPAFLTVTGRIESLDRTAYGARLVVRVADVSPAVERMPDRIRVTQRSAPKFQAGDAVSFKARLTPPAPAAVPGGYDFEREAFFQRLGAVGYVTGAVSAAEGVPEAGLWLRMVAGIDRARNGLTERIIAVVGGSRGAIAAALITGKRGQIAEADNEIWRAAGIFHLISISGLHMMLAAGLFFYAARLIFAAFPDWHPGIGTKKIAALIAMTGATAYDIFSGSEVATERSLIMTLVMFGAVLADRPALAMRNLAISALLILAFRPETVLGPSFQMSFGAVAALVAYGEAERRWHQGRAQRAEGEIQPLWQGALRLVVAFIATSIIAGLATAPFQAYHFHRLNPYGVLGNALAVPICSFVVMPAALLGVITYPLGIDAPVWWLMGQGIEAISRFAALVSGLEGAVMATGRFAAGALALLSAGLLLITLMTTWPFRLAGALLAALGLLLAARPARPDLIIDASGRTVMVRGVEGKLVLLGPSRPVFALQQWLSGDRDARSPRDPALPAGARCDRLGCTALLADGRAVALVLDKAGFAEDCARADILVTPLVAPDACWGRADIYDRGFLRQYGATYVRLTANGPLLETARNARIDRPWSPRRGEAPPATGGGQAQSTAPVWSPDSTAPGEREEP
jgi:competence protein ComEC